MQREEGKEKGFRGYQEEELSIRYQEKEEEYGDTGQPEIPDQTEEKDLPSKTEGKVSLRQYFEHYP